MPTEKPARRRAVRKRPSPVLVALDEIEPPKTPPGPDEDRPAALALLALIMLVGGACLALAIAYATHHAG